MESLLIGTSGYDYPEWKGVFYPENLKRQDFLSFYATKFNALELNFSFYSMPSSKQFLSFYERSNGLLKFSVKANNLLTHNVGFDWKNDALLFMQAVELLMEQDALSSVLFQFPQSFHYTKENRIYLAQLMDEFKKFPLVIEFRHEQWIRESVFQGLNERNAGIVFCDMPQLRYLPQGKTTSFTGKEAYIRLHGRNAAAWYAKPVLDGERDRTNGSARYDYEYSADELKEFIPVIHAARSEGRKVQVYFNNHPKGSGALNGLQLKEMLADHKEGEL